MDGSIIPELGYKTNLEGGVIGFGPAYGRFFAVRDWIHKDYLRRSVFLQQKWQRLEEASYFMQESYETRALEHWPQDKAMSQEILSFLTKGALARAMEQAGRINDN